jgi:(2S)-methylsuccinyl-CoA dehydrogenase
MKPIVPDLLDRCDEAVLAAEGLLAAARANVATLVMRDGVVSPTLLDQEQRAAHALAWLATYVEALRQMARWARALDGAKRLGEIERLLLESAFGEYLAQIAGGIAMSQNEIARPLDLGLDQGEIGAFWTPAVAGLTALGTRQRNPRRARRSSEHRRDVPRRSRPGRDNGPGARAVLPLRAGPAWRRTPIAGI